MEIYQKVISLIFLFYSIAALLVKEDKYMTVYSTAPNDYSDGNSESMAFVNSEKKKRDILMDSSLGRSGIRNTSFHWPNATIPFVIEGTYNSTERSMIKSAMDNIHMNTCVKFIPHTFESGYIAILNANFCAAVTGYFGVRQELYLESNTCFNGVTDIIHLLVHTMGFYQEIGRLDRDDYVIINYTNVKEEALVDFDKNNETLVSDFGVPFDYDSVMTFPATGGSSNGLPTIIPRQNVTIGRKNKLSKGDILKINRMYNCSCLPNTSCQQQSKATVVAT